MEAQLLHGASVAVSKRGHEVAAPECCAIGAVAAPAVTRTFRLLQRRLMQLLHCTWACVGADEDGNTLPEQSSAGVPHQRTEIIARIHDWVVGPCHVQNEERLLHVNHRPHHSTVCSHHWAFVLAQSRLAGALQDVAALGAAGDDPRRDAVGQLGGKQVPQLSVRPAQLLQVTLQHVELCGFSLARTTGIYSVAEALPAGSND